MSDTSPGEPRGSSPRFYLHLLAFVSLLGVWTWLLLEPYPVPPAVTAGLSADLKLILAKDGRRIEAMRFGALEPLPAQVRAAYRLGVNEFNGLKTVQVNVEHFE